MNRRFVCCQTGEARPIDDCIACAMTGKPARCKHPLPLLAWLRDAEPRNFVSVTSLNSCPRRNILTGQMYEKEVIDPKQDGWYKFRGTLIHQQMAGAVSHGYDVFAETRLFLDDWSGSPDLVLPRFESGARINDYKSTNANPLSITSAYQYHAEQVNFYAYLWRHGRTKEGVSPYEQYGTEVTSASIWYLDTRTYNEVEVELWNDSQTEELLQERLAPYQTWTTSGELPPILPDETWFNKVKKKLVTRPNHACTKCPVFSLCRAVAEQDASSSPSTDMPPPSGLPVTS